MRQWEHSAILLTFIELPFVIKIFILSIFEWLFYTGFTVHFFNNVINRSIDFLKKRLNEPVSLTWAVGFMIQNLLFHLGSMEAHDS